MRIQLGPLLLLGLGLLLVLDEWGVQRLILVRLLNVNLRLLHDGVIQILRVARLRAWLLLLLVIREELIERISHAFGRLWLSVGQQGKEPVDHVNEQLRTLEDRNEFYGPKLRVVPLTKDDCHAAHGKCRPYADMNIAHDLEVLEPLAENLVNIKVLRKLLFET